MQTHQMMCPSKIHARHSVKLETSSNRASQRERRIPTDHLSSLPFARQMFPRLDTHRSTVITPLPTQFTQQTAQQPLYIDIRQEIIKHFN